MKKPELLAPVGDTIVVDSEKGNYTISEIIVDKTNIPKAEKGQTVQIGKMKGNIISSPITQERLK